MGRFFYSIFGIFLSPLGLVALASLDSTVFFFLPAAVDTAVVILAARNKDLFWLYPILATCGSLAGTAITFGFGHKIGQTGLKRWVSPARLKEIHCKVDDRGAVAIG